ncbi:MAG TPA: OmpA family protein [Longimicrobiaceae bacterium]|nr:OmpA family protein [Longimicrobiaceae bacterium]
MKNGIVRAAAVLAVCVPAMAAAQQPQAHREGSWEFSLGGGALFVDPALRDFLGSGPPESRFASEPTPRRATPTAVARLGYNFNRHVGVSISGGGARGAGVTYLNPTGAVTFTGNLNAATSPFLLIGTELTRISGGNDRVTHSTWGANAGLGVRQMIGQNVALRLEGRVQFAGFKEVPMRRETTFSPLVQLGFSWFTRGRAPMVMAMAPPPRVDTVRVWRVDTVTVVRVERVGVAAPASFTGDQVLLRVQFRTARAELLPASRIVLDSVASAIKATPGSRWQVEGHTDNVGTAAMNRTLSAARARSVVDYLVSRGVDADALTAQGFGPDRPVATNATVEGRAQNRRVQMRRIPPPPAQPVP